MVLLNTKCIDLWFLFELVDVKKVSLWQSFLDVYSKALKPRQNTNKTVWKLTSFDVIKICKKDSFLADIKFCPRFPCLNL